MRLLTHNMLACNMAGVKNGYPLKIEAKTVEVKEVPLNAEFLKHMYPKVEWKAFRDAAIGLGVGDGLPESVTDANFDDEEFLKRFHHALLEVHVEEGSLVCPETGRAFHIKKGIPNMLLVEDEC